MLAFAVHCADDAENQKKAKPRACICGTDLKRPIAWEFGREGVKFIAGGRSVRVEQNKQTSFA